ncbi:MAG TPA: hypothetical protein VMV94_09715 [Phycisphaerae bacterium]|nr:hypothetical protein [Phycisphaerae bacterium]
MSLVSAIAAALLACLDGSSLQAGPLTIDRWLLEAGIITSQSGEGQSVAFATVENPFHDSHSASLGQSVAQASYDFDWSDNHGTFLIQSSQQAHDTGGTYHLEVLSEGYIKFTPTEDLAFSVDGTYSYYLPAYAMEAGLGFSIRDAQTAETFFAYGDSDNSIFGAPVSGTFAAQGSGILPAGRQYRFHYAMYLDTRYGASDTFTTGNGHVNFTITPEPITAFPFSLGLAVLAVPRRRHHPLARP